MAAFLIPLVTSVAGAAISANGQKKAAAAQDRATAAGQESSQQASDEQIAAQLAGINASSEARNDLVGEALGGGFLGRYGVEDIFGRRPEGVPYEPVDLTESLASSVSDNRRIGLPAALDFSTEVNERFAGDTLDLNNTRVRELYPGYDDAIRSYTGTTQALLNGQLPFDDVLDIVSDRQELTNSIGTPGTGESATLKDLGIGRLEAQELGGSRFQNLLGTLQSSVSPIPNYQRPDENFAYTMLTPQFRLGAEIQQAQLEQQSAQSQEFLAASPIPAAQNLFGAAYYSEPYAAGANATLQNGFTLPTSGSPSAQSQVPSIAPQIIGAVGRAAQAGFAQNQNSQAGVPYSNQNGGFGSSGSRNQFTFT